MSATLATKAAKAEKAAQLTLFVELAKTKLGLDYDGSDDLKAIAKKSPAELANNIARLQGLRDYDAPAPVAEIATWEPEAPRPSGNGNGSRRTATPRVSPKMRDYAASLLRELWAGDEDTAAELIAELGGYTADHISRMIESIKPILPITEGQTRFMTNLVAQKLAPGSDLAEAILAKMDSLTKIEAKRHLDDLQLLPDYVAPVADGQRPARRNGPEIEADGMYRDPATGDIYKVQVAVHGSGKLYAKKLVKLDEPEIKRGKEAHFAFEMARGAVMMLKPEWRLSLADAKEFGDLYGCCIKCGAVLTDEASRDAGIGPVCATKGWE